MIDRESDPHSWEDEFERAPWLLKRMHPETWPVRITYKTEEGETVEVEDTGTFQSITVSCDD